MNKWLLLLTILVILSSVVCAAPPFQSTNDLTQLEISVPKSEFMQEGLPFNFHIHVYNGTGHLQTNTTTTCFLHTYNNTGNHIISANMSFDTNTYDFYYEINSTVTEQRGLLPFITWCNSTVSGGFYSGSFEINDQTIVGITDDSTQGLSLLIFILFSTLIFFLLPKMYGKFINNEMVNLMITRFCYAIGFYLMVLNSAVIGEIASSAGYATNPVWRYTWLLGSVGWLLLISTILKTLIVDLPELYKKQVMEKRGMT